MRKREFFIHYGRQFGTLIGLLLLCFILWILTPHFLTVSNLLKVLEQSSINAVIAVGITFVIITAGIDLSVGSIVALAGVVLGSALHAGGQETKGSERWQRRAKHRKKGRHENGGSARELGCGRQQGERSIGSCHIYETLTCSELAISDQNLFKIKKNLLKFKQFR